MIIIAGKVYVAAEEREAFVSSFAEMVGRARKYPGCLDVVMASDPLEADRVNIFECFESEERLESWRAIANGPETGVEILRQDVQKHVISESGPPFS